MFAEELSAFFDQNDFAEAAVFTVAGNAVRNASVIFNTPTQDAQIYDTGLEVSMPFLTCRTSDLVGVRTKKDNVTINGQTYLVEKIVNDGTGISTVYLKA